MIVLLSFGTLTAAQDTSQQQIGDEQVSLMLPKTVARSGIITLNPDVRLEDKPNADALSLLPEHYLIRLNNSKDNLVGVVRIFRTADYEAYFPSSIPVLRNVLAKRDSTTVPDFGTLLLVNSVYTFRAQESFIDMDDGGTVWRMIAGYTSTPVLNDGEMTYIALGLSIDEYYFYQIYINMRYADLDSPTGSGVPTWQEVADDLTNRVLPRLNDAQPEDFKPVLTDLDALTMSLNIAANALPKRKLKKPFTPVVLEPQDTLMTLIGMIPQVDPVNTAQNAEPVTCEGFLPSRLVVGEQGQVLPGDPNNVRAAPDPQGVKMGQIPGGATFDVLEGPFCGNKGAWWRVHYKDIVGWTMEGQKGEYWVEPVK